MGPGITFTRTRTIAYSSFLVLGSLASLELGFRLVGVAPAERPRILLRTIDLVTDFPYIQPDRQLFWSPRPGFHGVFRERRVSINGLGLRGPRVQMPKPAGWQRIACFGDSITFGYGVHDEETYPARLRQAFAGRGIDVVNAGVNGYTSHQVLARFRQVAPAVEADVATFCVGWNDRVLRSVDDRAYARRVRAVMAVEGALNRLSLYRALSRAYLALAAPAFDPAASRTPRVSVGQYCENLESMIRESRARGISPVFIALPHRKRPGGEPQRDHDSPYPSLLLAAARARHVPLVEVADLEFDAPRPSNEEYFLDSIHLSVAGNARLAAELARELQARGVLRGR